MSDADAAREGGSGKRLPEDGPKRTGPVTFYRQVVAELRKVVYPTREQLITYFLVVMAFVLVMVAIISALDYGFGKLAFQIFGGAGGEL